MDSAFPTTELPRAQRQPLAEDLSRLGVEPAAAEDLASRLSLDASFHGDTLACAEVIRELTACRCGKHEVARLLRQIKVPNRTAARARRLAGLCSELWNAVQSDRISASHAELLDRCLAKPGRHVDKLLKVDGKFLSLVQVIALAGEQALNAAQLATILGLGCGYKARPRSRRPSTRPGGGGTKPHWKVTPKKRLRVYSQDVGLNGPVADLAEALGAYEKLCSFLGERIAEAKRGE